MQKNAKVSTKCIILILLKLLCNCKQQNMRYEQRVSLFNFILLRTLISSHSNSVMIIYFNRRRHHTYKVYNYTTNPDV